MSIITKKALSRRTVLRGVGATMALPLLDAMVPALTALSKSAVAPVRRFGAVYVGNGMNMMQWTPPAEGALQLTPTQQPLAPFQDRLLVVSGLDNRQGDGNGGGQHPRMQTSWLTGCRAKKSEGVDLGAGTSMDQIVARQFGQETQLASLELATESPEIVGACFLGYSCAYSNTISWRTPKVPLPMENNPRAVFERLFGASDSTDPKSRLADIETDRSILDAITQKIGHLEKGLGSRDRAKLTDYLDAVRDIERRLHKAEEQVGRELPVVEQPIGIPATFEDHAKLMLDLQVLAFQTDLTRVFSFLLAREASIRTYPEIGVPDPHHPLSHHQNDPQKLAGLAKVNAYHVKMLAYFLEKLQTTSDGDGCLLDQTMLLYGGGMSDPNLHMFLNVPTMVVAGKGYGLKGGRHLQYPEGTPLANLELTMLEKLGLSMEQFGDSNGELDLLSI